MIPAHPVTLTEQELVDVAVRKRRFLMSTAYKFMHNYEDAEDVVQDALLNAFRFRASFTGRSSVGTWLTRIVMNAAMMRLRKRRDLVPLDAEITERVRDPRPTPEAACIQADKIGWILHEAAQLSPILHRSFAMRYQLDMMVQDIAGVQGVSVGCIKSHLSRANAMLRAQV